ncbi:MAG: hypothetical protein ABJE95_32590, partial [Byssovorax sp.]
SVPRASPRTGLLEQLLAAVGAAVADGYLEAARVAHEAAEKLLAGSTAASTPVVDLARERAKRSRS